MSGREEPILAQIEAIDVYSHMPSGDILLLVRISRTVESETSGFNVGDKLAISIDQLSLDAATRNTERAKQKRTQDIDDYIASKRKA